MINNKKINLILSFLAVFLIPLYCVHATDLTSTNFTIKDPIVGGGGGAQSSASFKLFGLDHLIGTGSSSSASFLERTGALYYPYVVSGTLTATLNVSNVELDWTATASGLGFNVSEYEVGIATTSGGPYTYTSVGTNLDYTYVNLEPDEYFFVVRTLDGLSNPMTLSNEENVTVPQIISFSISDNSIGFSTINSASPRYATGDASGSGSDTSAHTLQIQTNASLGYSIAYSGTTFSGPEVITEATITNDADGTPGSKQFAVAFSTDGGATITSSYDHDPTPSNRNWKFTTSGTDLIATESAPTALQTIQAYYLANISTLTSAGNYTGVITYTATANF